MNFTKAVSRIAISILCAVLILSGEPLSAADNKLWHEAFMRGGKAITAALISNTEKVIPLTKAFEDPLPAIPRAPAPPQSTKASGMSKKMWALLIGGFAAGGAIIYWAATGPGASIRNCSTCEK